MYALPCAQNLLVTCYLLLGKCDHLANWMTVWPNGESSEVAIHGEFSEVVIHGEFSSSLFTTNSDPRVLPSICEFMLW